MRSDSARGDPQCRAHHCVHESQQGEPEPWLQVSVRQDELPAEACPDLLNPRVRQFARDDVNPEKCADQVQNSAPSNDIGARVLKRGAREVASNSASPAQRDYFEPQRCSYSILGPPVSPVTASAKFTGACRGWRIVAAVVAYLSATLTTCTRRFLLLKGCWTSLSLVLP
jgi:hypothetical protein